jgi:hypothetical protein
VSYTFGADSIVRQFYSEYRGNQNNHVSTWKISTEHRYCSLQNQLVYYRAIQCHDSEGPMLPPDFMGERDLQTVPSNYHAFEYRNLLQIANSLKKDGRYYVDGAHHYVLPESCFIIDPDDSFC